MSDRFLKGKLASEILNIHQRTLYQWEKKGWIETKRTKGNVRLYNVDRYLRELKINNGVKCYCEEDFDKTIKKLNTQNEKIGCSSSTYNYYTKK